MDILEIIFAIILIIACVFIVIVVLMKDTKTKMSQTISGTSSDSYFGKNSGRTKDAMLNKATVVAAIIFFVLSLTVNVINLKFGKSSDSSSSTSASDSVTSNDNVDDVIDLDELLSSTEESSSQTESNADESAADSQTESNAETQVVDSESSVAKPTDNNAESGSEAVSGSGASAEQVAE